MKLSEIKANPNNPRVIKDDRFQKLVKSILEFPKMMELRPIVYDELNIIQGGNMRNKALCHIKKEGKEKTLQYLESVGMPENIVYFDNLFLKGEISDGWVKKAIDLTEEEKRRFIIADNVGFGEHDWEVLKNDWDNEELKEWGIDIPDWALGIEANSMTDEDVDINEEFNPIGISSGQQKVVFTFDGADEAVSYLNSINISEYSKKGQAWQVNMSTLSI